MTPQSSDFKCQLMLRFIIESMGEIKQPLIVCVAPHRWFKLRTVLMITLVLQEATLNYAKKSQKSFSIHLLKKVFCNLSFFLIPSGKLTRGDDIFI